MTHKKHLNGGKIMYDKLNHNQLEHVSGGQYDHNAVYIDTHAVHSGNLYNIHNIRETVGTISVGQAVQMHPDFWDLRDGEIVCIVKIDGTDYTTERVNIALFAWQV